MTGVQDATRAGSMPATVNDADHAAIASRDAAEVRAAVSRWLSAFEAALAAGDAKAIEALCERDSHWRDVLAFTWHITPRVGAEAIARGFVERPPSWLRGSRSVPAGRLRDESSGWDESALRLCTTSRRGSGGAKACCGCFRHGTGASPVTKPGCCPRRLRS